MKSLIIMGSGTGYSEVKDYIKKSDDRFDIWGCATNLFHKNMPYTDLIFEIHKQNKELNNIYKKMKEYSHCNYITESKIIGIKSIIYPIEKINEKYGRYFCSSFAYMLVYAIEQGYKKIVFAGIGYDNQGTFREQLIEKPNLEYWIGRAEGMGIEIDTSLCPFLLTSWKMYGFERLSEDKKYLELMAEQILRDIKDVLDEDKREKIMKLFKNYVEMCFITERM